MGKKLKIWNGRSYGRKYERHHVYVAAYSVTEAARLVSLACFKYEDNLVPINEINVYYNKDVWGNIMDGIIPTEPCVYLSNAQIRNAKPFRVI